MSSKYSIKELAIGHSFPLRLRFILDKGISGQNSTVKKLTNILFDRVNTPQNVRYSVEKENCNQFKMVQNFNKMSREKSKRVVSQKQQRTGSAKKETKQKLFLDILNYDHEEKQAKQKNFKPYRLQPSYKKAPQSESHPALQSIESKSSCPGLRLKINTSNKNQSWRVEKWQTPQEKMTCSFLLKLQEKE